LLTAHLNSVPYVTGNFLLKYIPGSTVQNKITWTENKYSECFLLYCF
jgi:hypothetical protein